MALLLSIASPTTSNIADLFTKPLSRHQLDTLIGDTSPTTTTASVISTLVASTATATVVAPPSDSGPTLHPNLDLALPFVLDTGATRTTFPSDFCVAQASYGLFRSPILVVSKALTSKLASTPVDPYTLITGEDVSVDLDLSSPDTIIDSDSGSSFTTVSFDIRQFGTSTLTFIYSKSTSELLHLFVDPTQIDWLHWVPLPRLILPESYYHIFGLDYLQAFTLFHLIPIWIYCLLHFVVNLED